ncbi:hypothetical protein ALQ04_200031 [Pseudomonas cichorii]|uniref:Uncharacterized protein n=1 Tax=Pseudomonas cichorii TaxID=36746 RepID=A0A3M4LJ10_PSECI|nr:hypothetical protein ALQ04_200031 [Pseudomonas cichorii]
MRMEARKGQTRLVRGLVHDSRTPLGGKPKAKTMWIAGNYDVGTYPNASLSRLCTITEAGP